MSQPWLSEAVGTAEWTGTPLKRLLAEAGPDPDAVDVVFTGMDHGVERGVEQDYARGLPLAEAGRDEVLLAYEMNGSPLPPQHGFPVRLVVPGWYGMAHVKWLRAITVLDRSFRGYQQEQAYRISRDADDSGEPVTRMRPRALVIPPGFPDFMSRTRVVDTGPHVLQGRAWSGAAAVARVEVSTDGGVRGPMRRWPRAGRRGRGAGGPIAGTSTRRARTNCVCALTTRRETCSRSVRRGIVKGWRTTRCSGFPSSHGHRPFPCDSVRSRICGTLRKPRYGRVRKDVAAPLCPTSPSLGYTL